MKIDLEGKVTYKNKKCTSYGHHMCMYYPERYDKKIEIKFI